MTSIVPRRDFKYPNEQVENSENKKIIMPLEHAFGTAGKKQVYKIELKPALSNSAGGVINTSSSPEAFQDLNPGEVGEIENLYWLFKITGSGGSTTCGKGSHICSEWRVKNNKGSGEELARWHPEQIEEYINQLPQKEKEYWLKACWITETELKEEGVNLWTDGDKNVIPNSSTKYLRVPCPWSVVRQGALNMHHISKSLRFYFKFSKDWVSDNYLQIDGIWMIVHTPKLTPGDEMKTMEKLQKQPHSYNYLSYSRLVDNTKTLTSATSTNFDLSQFSNHKSAYLMMNIKANSSPVYSDKSYWQPIPIGDDSAIDLKNSGGDSMFGNGNNVLRDDLLAIYCDNTESKPIRGHYIIPFTESLLEANHGIFKGFYQFYNQKDNLNVSWGTATTAEIQTLNCTSAANDGGRYILSVDGHSTDSLAYNASAAAIKSALEALPPLSNRNYSVTSSGTLETDATVTFDSYSGYPNKEIGLIKVNELTLNDGGTGDIISTSVTTNPYQGWTTTSSNTVTIDSAYYRNIMINEFGDVKVRNL